MISPEAFDKIRSQRKWQTVESKIDDTDLRKYILFLNDAVVLRQSAEGVPLMTTTAIYGPIRPGSKVALTPGKGTGVTVIAENCTEISLIKKLEELEYNASEPEEGNAITVRATWLSSEDGGAIPSLDASANVFGSTGSLYVNERAVVLPVLDIDHPDYHDTLAFYGGKLLKPKEEFCMGFDKILFGMEYDTSLPDYIRNYAMSPFGGGGMFVEHHPFPHIFLPRPTEGDHVFCEAKVTLGRKVKINPEDEDKTPRIRFTTFRVPSDGSAIAIKPSTIHNDSFTNGRLAVFVANTAADTVAFRETSPFKNISVKDR
jgi:hypothetical protein